MENSYIIIILISLIIFLNYNSSCKKIEKLAITENERDDIYYFLKIISYLFNENNITFWIIGGTTLGSVRHNDIVPWDDDADIGIFDYDMETVLELNDELNEIGYEIVPAWKIYKFRKIGTEYPFIDIFCYKKEGNRYIMNRQDIREIWPNEYYLVNELFPLKLYKFGNGFLPGPNYPLDYLDRMYPNWRNIGKHTFDHKENKGTDITVELEYENPEHKLKPKFYVNSNSNVKRAYDKYHNKKIITIQ
jgi:phosphorylcholine metabolism protein LicD